MDSTASMLTALFQSDKSVRRDKSGTAGGCARALCGAGRTECWRQPAQGGLIVKRQRSKEKAGAEETLPQLFWGACIKVCSHLG